MPKMENPFVSRVETQSSRSEEKFSSKNNRYVSELSRNERKSPDKEVFAPHLAGEFDRAQKNTKPLESAPDRVPESSKHPEASVVELQRKTDENQLETFDKREVSKEIKTDLYEDAFFESLSANSKSIWESVSGFGKKIATTSYEVLYKIPVVNRLVAKVEIAYHQKWEDIREKSMLKNKEKFDEAIIQMNAFSRLKELHKNNFEKGLPGKEVFLLEMKKMEREIAHLEDEKNKYQTKIEASQNAAKMSVEKRNLVAEKMVGKYDKALEPMKRQLELLEEERTRIDGVITRAKIAHTEKKNELDELKRTKEEIEASYRDAGMSEKTIRKNKSVKSLEKILQDGYEKIRTSELRLEEKRRLINERIAKADAKAAPYRDRRDAFARVKKDRPIEVDLPERMQVEDKTIYENAASHSRKADTDENISNETYTDAAEVIENIDSDKENDTHKNAENDEESDNEIIDEANEKEAPEELEDIDYEASGGKGDPNTVSFKEERYSEKTMEIGNAVELWNRYLQDKVGPSQSRAFLLNVRMFLSDARISSASDKTKLDDFGRILKAYYSYKRIPLNDAVLKAMGNFFEKNQWEKNINE